MTDYRSDLLKLLDERGYIHQLTDAAGLDTLAHGAGAGLPDLEKIKDEVGIFVQDDKGDIPLGVGAPLRQVGQPG